jgi:hypothetical protein
MPVARSDLQELRNPFLRNTSHFNANLRPLGLRRQRSTMRQRTTVAEATLLNKSVAMSRIGLPSERRKGFRQESYEDPRAIHLQAISVGA